MKPIIYFVIIIFLIICQTNISCNSDNTSKSYPQTNYTIDTSIYHNKEESALSIILESYADSINNSDNKSLPKFLEDSQFDYSKASIWIDLNSPISIRMSIMSKVVNCQSLYNIIKSKNIRYGIKPLKKGNLSFPYSEYSFLELASIRASELKCPGLENQQLNGE